MQDSGSSLQEENSAPLNLVPLPMPRRQLAVRPTTARSTDTGLVKNACVYEPAGTNYENVYIMREPHSPEGLSPNKVIEQPGRPVPAPRTHAKVVLFSAEEHQLLGVENRQAGTQQNESYQNVVVLRPTPVTIQVKQVATDGNEGPVMNNDQIPSVDGSPVLPFLSTKINNNLHDFSSVTTGCVSGVNLDCLSVGSGESGDVEKAVAGTAANEGSDRVGPAESKYKTSSPVDLFKTIGSTTRLLTEAIGERVAHKTKKAASNMRHTSSNLMHWGAKSVVRKEVSTDVATTTDVESSKSVAVTSGFPNGLDAQTGSKRSPGLQRLNKVHSPDMIQKINFDSPLPLNNIVDVSAGYTCEINQQQDQHPLTYDVPKRCNKQSNLLRSLDLPAALSTASSSMACSGGEGDSFQPNASANQSLYSRVIPKRTRRHVSPSERTSPRDSRRSPAMNAALGTLVRSAKTKSESNLYESTFYIERPVTANESSNHLYGKLNIIARPSVSSSSSASSSRNEIVMAAGAGSDEDNNLPELLRAGVQVCELLCSPDSNNLSTRVACCSSPDGIAKGGAPTVNRTIFSRCLTATNASPLGLTPDDRQHRSNSWNFYDIPNVSIMPGRMIEDEVDDEETLELLGEEEEDGLTHINTPEFVYVNEELRHDYYGQLADMEYRSVLQPPPAELAALWHDYDEVSIAEIIDEFDPFGRASRPTLEANIQNDALQEENETGTAGQENQMLIENLLSAESYNQEPYRQTVTMDGKQHPVPSCPNPPQRSDSLLVTEAPVRAVSANPKRNKFCSQRPPLVGPHRTTAISVIVHQNLKLPGTPENLVDLDERLIEPHLATLDEQHAPTSVATGTIAVENLSYPKPPQTSWYLNEAERVCTSVSSCSSSFEKRLNVNPMNERSNVPGRKEKAAKSSLTSELVRLSTEGARGDALVENEPVPPTYFEAIGGTDSQFQQRLAATVQIPKQSTSVATKLLNALKRRPSLNPKATSEPSTGGGPSTVRTAIEMVPKPRLTERQISHKGHVLKFPSGKIGDMLNELAPRSVVLRERIFQTYLDPQQTLPKEAIQLRYILSLQCILQHKFAGEGRLDLHCFEIVLGMPKGVGGDADGGSFSNAAAASMMLSSTNPDLLITSGGSSGNVKLARQSYMFGTHKRSDRNLWMAKVLQSVTDVFGGEGELLREFLRAGWCYVKKSVSAVWTGAWLLLAKRRLYLYTSAEDRLEELDLRKARCIGAIENEQDTIGNLHVEFGPSLFIDCPPYATLYFIMGSPRETHIWHKVVRQAAHRNGPTLHSQQLTRSDVPVLIDKCVNFIYAHGSMSEGIYRKSGSQSAVARILQLFAEDAFNVQLTRNQYNEYDVAGALKKFIRELPGSFFGNYAASFVAIGSLSGGDIQLKIDSYRQLLERLPRIEYSTLKKLIGHLAFIASLEQHNRMGVANLAMIWSSTLLANASQNTVQELGRYHQQDADVVADLILLNRRLFPVGEDELRRDQLMLTVLQKYHAAAENLSDAVKHSGDLKVWITVDCETSPDSTVGTGATVTLEDKQQVNVDITPVKTASDVCKELANKTKYPWYKLTLYEVIATGALVRPLHYSEKVLEVVVRWSYWGEADRKHNYLTLKLTTTLNDVYRTIQKTPVLTPTMELKFADRRTKTLRNYQLQQVGRGLVVLKKIEKKDKVFEELCKIDLARVTAYIGCEPKRDRSSLRWAITLVDNDFKKRTRDAPYIGHIFGGLDFASQILWYSSILYSLYKDDILPSGDLFF